MSEDQGRLSYGKLIDSPDVWNRYFAIQQQQQITEISQHVTVTITVTETAIAI